MITATNNDTALCIGQSTLLTASGGSSYSWNTGSTATSITVQTFFPGLYHYTVTATNSTGCSSSNSISIRFFPLPVLHITASDTTICMGDAVTLSASGGTIYSWIGYGLNQNQIEVFPTTATTYTVGAVDANGCSNAATFTEMISTISVNAGNDQTICPGFTVQLAATASGDTTGLTWEWFKDSWDSLIPNSNFPSISPNPPRDSTQYIVGAYNSNGCWNKDTVTVFFDALGTCGIHVYTGITPNGDGSNDEWWIDGIRAFHKNDVAIFNRWGMRVWEGKNYDNDKVIWKGTNSSGAPLPDGTYYYVVNLYDTDGKRIFTDSKWVEVTH